jgi:hypothetical protein
MIAIDVIVLIMLTLLSLFRGVVLVLLRLFMDAFLSKDSGSFLQVFILFKGSDKGIKKLD